MSLNYTKVDIRGKAATDVLGALFFENETVANKYVAFEENVKADTVFSEYENEVALQAYTSGEPTSNGGIKLKDTLVQTPKKVMSYFTFDPETLRSGRFGQTMQPGAFNIMSSEFEQKVLSKYGPSASAAIEAQFWGGITAADKVTIAAQTGHTTQETNYAANVASVGQFSGVIAEVIKAENAIKVSGIAISSANIAAEYAKLYAKIVDAKLDASSIGNTVIYAPKSHKSLVNIANISATYRDIFTKVDGKYFYLDVEIRFVPMSSNNVMYMAKDNHVVWATDLAGDASTVKIDAVSNNSEEMFVKLVATVAAHIAHVKNSVLYIG